ncbi:hypothetical protein [Micromonospora aurantiaca (nom. illeg.)]|uniref:hypothetical protein n=1 Tax=Micromonospora aurantiaca (nom. illeg.) TaxID=47850 RepID=UPI0033CFA825
MTDVLDRLGHEVGTAGEPAALMAALSASTPVSVAETLSVDAHLPPAAATVTSTVVKAIRLIESEPVDVVEADGRIQRHSKVLPGIELGTVILAEGQQNPDKTVPYPAAEQALDALGGGDVDGTVAAYVRLLGEVAEILSDPPPGTAGMPETVPSWIDDADLRQEVAVEAERLRYGAARLGCAPQEVAREAAQFADEA